MTTKAAQLKGENQDFSRRTHSMCVLLSFLNVSQKAKLLINDTKSHQSLVYRLHKSSAKINELIFRKYSPRCEKTMKHRYLAWYRGENNGRGLEALLKLVYATLDDSRGNIDSEILFFAINFQSTTYRMRENRSYIFDR